MKTTDGGNESSGLLAKFLRENVCDEITSSGFIYPLEISWLLETFGVQANFGWDEDGLFAARQAIESLKRWSRNRRILDGVIDQMLGDITRRISTCEARLVLVFLRKLDEAIGAGEVDMRASGVNPCHITDLIGRRRFFLRAVLAILVRYRAEPFKRGLRPVEEGKDPGVIAFPCGEPPDDADDSTEEEEDEEEDRLSSSSTVSTCQIFSFPIPFPARP